MSSETYKAFEEFRALVLQDADLQKDLREISDLKEFVNGVVERGKRAGFIFSPEDVNEAMQTNKRLWFERWM